MTYIKLEDVQKILESIAKESKKEFDLDVYPWWISKAKKRIKILPYINPEEILLNMSHENRDEVYMEWKETTRTEIEYELLQELLQKFKS